MNLLYSDRQLSRNYKTVLDWSGREPMEDEVYASQSKFDALNRCVEFTSADDSTVYYKYDEAGYLQSLTGRIRDSEDHTSFVRNTEYNAKAQRTSIEYGNGTMTQYSYDPNTFQLIHLFTRRDNREFPDDEPRASASQSGGQVQNLCYTFDAVGNITKVIDKSQQRIFHKNIAVEPSNEYTYDALYRLIEATGREHLSLAKKPTAPGELFKPVDHRNDSTAMSKYLESYKYDEVGNFVWMQHQNTSSNAQGVCEFCLLFWISHM
jgi:YD repeat-containing protein